ncbi:MAG TPA: class I SAM-dependent methyltransferase [Usitatibacter sp.]|nr:class I SAM-dependent methyltransferase [Usitatibacter sp.]
MRQPAQRPLAEAARKTLHQYNRIARRFWRGTRNHDVGQNIDALLSRLPGTPPFAILDFGCGPGRDLRRFRELGHAAIGLDGAERMVTLARRHSGCEVWHQNFLELDLPAGRFDGIYANASLFHVPAAELPRVLRELHAALKPDGALFCSNPRGRGREEWRWGCYGGFRELEDWEGFVSNAGFTLIEHFYRPSGQPRHRQPWLATVWRRLPPQ